MSENLDDKFDRTCAEELVNIFYLDPAWSDNFEKTRQPKLSQAWQVREGAKWPQWTYLSVYNQVEICLLILLFSGSKKLLRENPCLLILCQAEKRR